MIKVNISNHWDRTLGTDKLQSLCDGSKLVFLLLEAIRGKAIDPMKEGYANLIGFSLMMLLIICEPSRSSNTVNGVSVEACIICALSSSQVLTAVPSTVRILSPGNTPAAAESVSVPEERRYQNRPVWQRMIFAAAGSIMNVVTAIVSTVTNPAKIKIATIAVNIVTLL